MNTTTRAPRRFRRRLLLAMLTVGLAPAVGLLVLGEAALGRVLSVSLAPLERTLERVDAELGASAASSALRDDLRPARLNLAQAELARRSLQRLLPRAVAGLLLFSVVALGATALALGRTFTGPVERLTTGMARYARGELGQRIPERRTSSPDELELLVRRFNVMGDELERQRARLQVTEAIAASHELARAVAHELKNPLTAMRMAAGRLSRPPSPDPASDAERHRDALGLLDEQIGVLMRMAQSFAELGRLPAPVFRKMDLRALVEDCCRLYRHDSPVPIECQAPASPIVIDGDADQLRRAFGNLLRNAAEASRAEDGPIRIVLSSSGTSAQVVVEDGGHGIPEPLDGASLARPQRTTKPQGSGLGLPIAQKILHDHGGSLRLEPAPPRGTRASVQLPESAS